MSSPEGPISLAEEYLRATLADVTAFRTWCGAANQAAALAKIHNDALPEPTGEEYTKTELQTLAPYAIISTAGDNGFRMEFRSLSGSHDYRDSGTLILRLVQFVSAEDTITQAERKWKDSLGAICTGLFGLAGQAGYLAITTIELAELVRFHPDDDPALGDSQCATLSINWGSD